MTDVIDDGKGALDACRDSGKRWARHAGALVGERAST